MSQVKRKMMIINRILKININLVAINGGIIHYSKKIIEGIPYQLVNSHTTEENWRN